MDLYTLTKAATKDTSGKLEDPTDFENNVAAAIKQYSKYRPQELCADIAGQDSPDISLPEDWAAGFSTITAIEYPIGSIPECLIDPRDWRFYKTPTGTFIRFSDLSPASVAEVRLQYTGLHTEATIPLGDLDAVANLAASYCCRQLAAAFAQTNDPTIQADSVNYRSKSGEFTSLANKLEGLFKNHLGVRDNDTTTAAMTTAPPPSRDRLTHGRQ